MFNKILIANRGEIACRVIKTAKRLGIATVAVYSDADADSLHVHMADEAIHIGGSAAKDSYLQAERVIDAALTTGAQAIHPGYGFLSENAAFCRLCEQHNIKFIGPPVGAIEAMGSKSAAKSIMEKANVPLVPGYHGDDQSESHLKAVADNMGYPVLLKAAAGGGGKGMRQVWAADEFSSALAAAKREAISSFGDDLMLIEKYLTQPRHVEIQVFCDQHDGAVFLFERDCSVQRRHQKVIEEAPAPGMTAELRQKMGEAAIKSAKAIGYEGAGTVEFLLDKDGSFYFMEMNTRLQVEHPVTEKITGQDLVEWQLRVAATEPLPLKQDELQINGHAFEARIYAEDPNNDFLPATGRLTHLHPPTENTHVRVDTGVRQGDDVSIYYDPMIAKLIVWDENRDKALQRLSKALAEYQINGVTTNVDFLYNLATCSAFKEAELDTGFIEKHQDDLFHTRASDVQNDLVLSALYLVLAQDKKANDLAANTSDPHSPWHITNAWRANEAHIHNFGVTMAGEDYQLIVEQLREGSRRYYLITLNNETFDCQGSITHDVLTANINGHRFHAKFAEANDEVSIYRANGVVHFSRLLPDCGNHDDHDSGNSLIAPMNGTVVNVLTNAPTKLKQGDPILIMEAMKMEHTIVAPTDGLLKSVFYKAGDLVDGGAELADFEIEE